MNTESPTVPPSPIHPKIKWCIRHKKFYANLMVILYMLIGISPGIGTLFIFGNLQSHHIPLTKFQGVILLIIAFTSATFGALLGVITGCVALVMEKLYRSEEK